MHVNLEALVLGSLVVWPLEGSLGPWVEDSLAGMEDTLLDMPVGLLGNLLRLGDILGQVGGMQEDSLVQHWVGGLDDDLGGRLAEVADKVAGPQDIQD